jgi:hypothetical protein
MGGICGCDDSRCQHGAEAQQRGAVPVPPARLTSRRPGSGALPIKRRLAACAAPYQIVDCSLTTDRFCAELHEVAAW